LKVRYDSDGNVIEITDNSFIWMVIAFAIMAASLCIGIAISGGFN